MSEIDASIKMTDLVKLFISEAGNYKNRQETKEIILQFHHRKTQLETLCEKGKMLSNCSVSMENKKISHNVPKRKLSPRIKDLEKLIEEYETSPEIIVKPKKFDSQSFEEMFSDIEDKLKAVWKIFANYDKRADSYIKIADDDPLTDNTLKKLKGLVDELNNLKAILPEKIGDIDYVQNIKEDILQKCDCMEAEGLDEEIGKFLVEVRSLYGFPLKKLLRSEKILDWLKIKDRAESFKIQRKKL